MLVMLKKLPEREKSDRKKLIFVTIHTVSADIMGKMFKKISFHTKI